MEFKNSFEKVIFEKAQQIFGANSTRIEHNKVIQIEDTSSPSVASFTGPPKKEIDVLSINISEDLNIQLLVSCKQFTTSKASPAHIQEWCSVLNTMNKHSTDSTYLGIVISSSGFTSGCESWASSNNIGLIPPLKGIKNSSNEEVVISMFERFCTAISKRLQFPIDDLVQENNFFDFCFSITSDFEGFLDTDKSSRYKISSRKWHSNFSELVSNIIGKKVISIHNDGTSLVLRLEENFLLKCTSSGIQFGIFDEGIKNTKHDVQCTKNLNDEQITFNETEKLISGKTVTSAADFQTYIEVGINKELNLALIPPNRIHLMIFNEIKPKEKSH